MKTNTLALLLLLCFLLFSCKQEPNPQPYSTWTIGSDSFSTNQVSLTHSKAGTSLSIGNAKSKFYYRTIGGIPEDGKYPFDLVGTNNPAYLDVFFSKDSLLYEPMDSSSFMSISRSDGIVTMEMPLSRFRNYKDSTGIQWIKATIRVRE